MATVHQCWELTRLLSKRGRVIECAIESEISVLMLAFASFVILGDSLQLWAVSFKVLLFFLLTSHIH